ncbi:LytTR family transcriptional regulator [Anaerorhabdus sp.]|uniref:LytTR family transcriptional regulator n=1 Tax=Anaerorhabdus sp. TaxID=1872524 RepID=UPI002FCC83E3
MKLTLATIVKYTEYMLNEFYHLNKDPLFTVMHDDVVWIGPGNIFMFGKAAAENSFKDGFKMPPVEMENAEFYQIQTDENSGIVVGMYDAHTALGSDQIAAVTQRITCYYRRENENAPVLLTHWHVSNEWNELVDDEVFPNKIGTETYRYVQKLLSDYSHKSSGNKIEIKTSTSLTYLDASLILYAEAMGSRPIIHLVDKSITINQILGKIISSFPSNFYRPHRGYLVNCDFIVSIERYNINLISNHIIPIPEKKYSQVRDEISKLLKKK